MPLPAVCPPVACRKLARHPPRTRQDHLHEALQVCRSSFDSGIKAGSNVGRPASCWRNATVRGFLSNYNSQFFVKFADKCRLGCLARFDFSPRKFPQTRHIRTDRALLQQHPACSVHHSGCDNSHNCRFILHNCSMFQQNLNPNSRKACPLRQQSETCTCLVTAEIFLPTKPVLRQ